MKTALKILKGVLVGAVVAMAIGMMAFTVVSTSTFDRVDRDLFGYRAFIALSDSMKATDFEAGDLVLAKKVDPATLQAGDIVAYTSQGSSNYGEVVTHKIRALTTDAEGQPGFVTYGTTTGADDEAIVTYPYVLGKYVGCLPGVGSFFRFLKTAPGYVLCIFLPFLILIMLEGARSVRLFRKYKAEQMEELRAERAAAEAERAEAQRMMRELAELREQMGRASPRHAAPPSGVE